MVRAHSNLAHKHKQAIKKGLKEAGISNLHPGTPNWGPVEPQIAQQRELHREELLLLLILVELIVLIACEGEVERKGWIRNGLAFSESCACGKWHWTVSLGFLEPGCGCRWFNWVYSIEWWKGLCMQWCTLSWVWRMRCWQGERLYQ